MAVDVGSAVGYLDLDISGFLAGLRTAQNEADSATKNMATKVGGGLKTVGDKITSAGSTLTKTVTLPLAGIATAGLKVATDFEKGMSQVKAISGATGKEFDSLREKAIELGADTAFSSNEVAEAMTEMAKAGWTSQQILDGMSGVLDAAAASGEGLGSVATIVADTITGFGMEAKESTRVADLLTQAANAGTIGVADLGESFKYIAPVAATMGFSIEDVTTAISAMSMAGIKGSQAGTSLRTALVRMVKPNDNTAASMKELGIVLTNADGSFKSLDQIVTEMRSSFSGLTDEQQTYHAATLAGQEGMSGLLSLLNLTQEEYDAIADSMNNASGVAAKTATVMQDNLASKVEQLGGSLESLAIKLADYVIPHLQKFVLWLTDLVDKFTELDPETQKSILKWGAFAIALGPVLMAVGKLTSGIGGVITAFGKAPAAFGKLQTGLKGIQTGFVNINEGFTLAKAGFPAMGAQASKLGVALAGVTAPMIAIVAAIAVLIAAFATLWKTNEDFRNKMIAIWNQIKETVNGFLQGIVDRVNALGFDFKNIADMLWSIWKGFCDLLAPVFEGVFQQIANILDVVFDVILGILDIFIGIFTGNWEQVWEGIKGIFKGIWDFLVATFQNYANVFTGILDTVCGWFGTTWENTWNAIKQFFVDIWNGIVSFFIGVLTGIQTFFQGIWEGITSFITTTLTTISTTFSNIWNSITSFLSSAWETIKNVVQVGIMFIVELISAAFQLITLPFRFIWENCKETIISIWDAISNTISTVLTAIQNVITTVWNAVSAFFTTIWTAISTFISTIWNTIKTNVTNTINAIKVIIDTVFNAIKTAITTVLTAISTTVNTIWNTIKTTISNIINSIKATIDSIWNAIKTTTTTVWNAIKTAITVPIDAAKHAISNVINSIKSIFSSGFNAVKSTVTSIFDSIKSKITSVMDGAKNIVSGAINKIKSFFNFSWSLPKLKMPHFKISGKFSLNPPSVPHFGIEWYKKAMGGGMILDSPTIFGFNSKTGKLLAGGEAGSETVVGTNSLMNMIKTAVHESNTKIIQTITGYFDAVLDNIKSSNEKLLYSIGYLVTASYQFAQACEDLSYVAYNGFVKSEQAIVESNKSKPIDEGGDTFIFNSPKPIDEIEAAKQMKQTKRELAEGF